MRKAKFLLMFVIFFSLVGCSNTELNVRADFYSYERNLSEISGVNEPTKLQILLEDFYLEKMKNYLAASSLLKIDYTK